MKDENQIPAVRENQANQSLFMFEAGPQVTFAEKGDDKTGTFEIIAYSGQIIENHFYWGNVAFDLQGVKFEKARTPVLEEHMRTARLGFTTEQEISDKVAVKGTFLDNERAVAIAADMKKGFPMQASLFIPPVEVEFVKEGESVTVNGHKLKGPGTVFRKATIGEISMCTLGADKRTKSKVFADGGEEQVEFSVTESERNHEMGKQTDTETKVVSAESFAADHKDVFEQVTATATGEGIKQERERVGKFAELFADDPKFALEQIAAGATEAVAMTAYAAKLKTENAAMAEKIARGKEGKVDPAEAEFSDDTEGAGGETGGGETATDEEGFKAEYAKSKDLQAEFGEEKNYLAFKRADGNGQVKIQGKS